MTEDHGGVRIVAVDPATAEVDALLAAYFAEIRAAFGYDDSRAAPADAEEFVPPGGRFLVVRDDDGTAAGCGGVRLLDPATAEVKRMWLDPRLRGRGVGRQLLDALEAAATQLGATRAVLDTNATLRSALALYFNAGWEQVPAYNDNREATHWFAKELVNRTADAPPPRPARRSR